MAIIKKLCIIHVIILVCAYVIPKQCPLYMYMHMYMYMLHVYCIFYPKITDDFLLKKHYLNTSSIESFHSVLHDPGGSYPGRQDGRA